MAAGDVAVNITTNNSRACAKFDGVDDKVDIGNITLLDGRTKLTMSVWFKTKGAISETRRIFGQSRNGGGAPIIYITASGLLRVDMDTSLDIASASRFDDSLWHNVVYTYDAGLGSDNMKLYADGTLLGSANNTSTINHTTDDHLTFGSASDDGANSQYFLGSISDGIIYDRPLTQAEVIKLFAGRTITNGLIGHWKLQDDYTDSTGSNDGTNTGTYLTIEDDTISLTISGQRVVASASGAYIQTGMKGGQIVSVAITETP